MTAPKPVGEGRAAALAVPLATIYLGLLFALPAKALPPIAYAGFILALSGSYFLIFFREISSRLRLPEYLLFAALVLLYVVLSRSGFFHEPDRLFATARIVPQAAGLVIMLITLPILAHAARVLFLPRPRLIPIGLILAAVTFSILAWQGSDNVLQEEGLYGVLSPGMMLQFVYFAFVLLVKSRALRVFLVLLPMPLLLASSNVVIQFVLALCVLLPRPRIIVPWLAGVLACTTLLIAFPPGPVAGLVAGDDNVIVRSRLWQQALSDIPKQPLGVGFGQSSVTVESFKDRWIRHVFSQQASRSLEVPNHNSFIDMALRLGWVGLGLFLLLIRRIWRGTEAAGMDVQATGAIAFILIGCAFNPVLESVRSTLFFAFALGYLWAIGGMHVVVAAADVRAAGDPRRLAISPAERRRELAGSAVQD